MAVSVGSLQEQGWNVSEESLQRILEEEFDEDQQVTIQDIVQVLLNLDLRKYTTPTLPRDLMTVSSIPGHMILQLLSTINLATPEQNQHEKPRLLQATFAAGGSRKIRSVEMVGEIDGLSLNTPPGTKYITLKPIEMREGVLFLGPSMLKELGGQVDDMIQEWKAGKQFISRSRGTKKAADGATNGTDDDGPPPFVPFPIQSVKKLAKQPKDTNKENIAPQKSGKSSSKQADKAQTSTKSNKKPKDASNAPPSSRPAEPSKPKKPDTPKGPVNNSTPKREDASKPASSKRSKPTQKPKDARPPPRDSSPKIEASQKPRDTEERTNTKPGSDKQRAPSEKNKAPPRHSKGGGPPSENSKKELAKGRSDPKKQPNDSSMEGKATPASAPTSSPSKPTLLNPSAQPFTLPESSARQTPKRPDRTLYQPGIGRSRLDPPQ
ncbi:hypothetical protein BZG36_02226 [Bifiguratus adelaidae]|uniref:RecQ-mediated genome instability protein 1 n=1 Tax=Bifiguratus adelaidae TaxID=1938954 RepID=A0A261Y3J1_9FUNG|nr:hypothetical protein BZG36_02226 [Bifiguratus adelaidae]